MLFNSFQFLIFFPVVTGLYFALPHGYRWMLLLAASCVFYMAFVPIYIGILAFTIVLDYTAAILIARSQGGRRRAWLVMSLAGNIGVLALFKYWNFMAVNLNAVAQALDWHEPLPLLSILLPIGLSFHTFQAMSYTIEVYRGRQPVERHFGIYALYVMFYPQLVAGPIERPQNLLHQFREPHAFDADRVFAGLGRMLWGMFKKVVIADRLAVIVNQVYDQPGAYDAPALVWATWFFAIQIYCDFSGYTDIALGAAEVMGFSLMENFDRPYLSSSIGEFWRRWHISLSTWFKDYVYVPLGGNRDSTRRRCRNLLIVFLLSGLWHGAAWTFLVWGALHGLYLVASVLTKERRRRLMTALGFDRAHAVMEPLRVLITFNLVAFAWIFFRANTLGDAQLIVTRLATEAAGAVRHIGSIAWRLPLSITPFSPRELFLAVALVGLLVFSDLVQTQRPLVSALRMAPAWARWSAYYAMVLLMLSIGLFGAQSFIYFQF
jgi:D-alanyl-lipoteichoic acid acyltransferase DltB (MBOAT superfamily)